MVKAGIVGRFGTLVASDESVIAAETTGCRRHLQGELLRVLQGLSEVKRGMAENAFEAVNTVV